MKDLTPGYDPGLHPLYYDRRAWVTVIGVDTEDNHLKGRGRRSDVSYPLSAICHLTCPVGFHKSTGYNVPTKQRGNCDE